MRRRAATKRASRRHPREPQQRQQAAWTASLQPERAMGECSRPEPEQGLTARRDGRLTVVNRGLGLGSRRAGRTGEGSGSITCHPPRARDYVTSGRSRGHLSERASVSHHAALRRPLSHVVRLRDVGARRDGLTSASFRRRMHLRLRGKEAGGGWSQDVSPSAPPLDDGRSLLVCWQKGA